MVNYLWKFLIKSILEKFPSLYLCIQRLRYNGKRYETKIAKKYFDLIIDGFPRSANSYSTRLFQHLEPRFLIGNHLHSHAHIKYGLINNIPTIVLIRNPFDAIISLVALKIINVYNGNKKEFLQENSLKFTVKSYINFYRPLVKIKNKLVLLKFDDITKNPSKAIKKINKVYGFNLETDKKVIDFYSKLIFINAKSHLKPLVKRNKIKESLIKEIKLDKKLEVLFEEAHNIFLEIID